jgi:glycosyltransferase involved in cell wall biosynthesis
MRRILREAYFRVRPGLPRVWRVSLRRRLAKRSLRLWSESWHTNPISSRAPEEWTGWPENRRFAFVLTHDVEGKSGLGRCRDLAELEMRLGFRSSFNFVPEGEYDTPESVREFLTSHGFEVGVHDLCHDGQLYASRKKFAERARKINRYLAEWGAVGFRSGFMLHNFAWLRDLDVLYDASSFDTDPFEPQPESVNTIFPFWVARGDGSGYVELPYTLPQDSTLFVLLREQGIDTWTQKLEWVARHGGMALVNVHPDYIRFNGDRHSNEYPANLYESFLRHVADQYGHEAWFALPRDVAAYFRDFNMRRSARAGVAPSDSSGAGVPCGGSDGHYSPQNTPESDPVLPGAGESSDWHLHGKRVAMVMFSYYPGDPRPRRAAEALAAKGMMVDVICLAERAGEPKREVVNGIEILRIPIKRRRGSGLIYAFQYSAFLLISSVVLAVRCLTRGYDLVYVHNMPDVLTLAGLIPKMFGAKIILDLHDPMPELMMTIFGSQPDAPSIRLLKRAEKLSIGIADAVVTVNRACARLFTSRSCPPQKMNVVMNSPDEHIFQARPGSTVAADRGSPDRPFVLMYHGSLVERNGLDLAVEALARILPSIPQAKLRVYGAYSPFLHRVMASVSQTGLQAAVEYLGQKSLEELVSAIEECDAGLIPNRRSIFTELNTPTRILEYLALGKPVIAPRAAGICDYFDENSIVFFELGSAEDLARKIEYVYAHPREMAEIAARGQQIHQQHRWAQERARLIRLVSSLLGEQNAVSAPAWQEADALKAEEHRAGA